MESASNDLTVDGDDNDIVSETPVRCESVETAAKGTSGVWKCFTKIGLDKSGVQRAACNFCSRDYAIGRNPKTNNNYGTSHLTRHMLVCGRINSSSVGV